MKVQRGKKNPISTPTFSASLRAASSLLRLTFASWDEDKDDGTKAVGFFIRRHGQVTVLAPEVGPHLTELQLKAHAETRARALPNVRTSKKKLQKLCMGSKT
eukprot:scaffold150572_cov20-Tisochrysis_lutea.AAC.1